jgi:hypothetical protein
MNNGLSYGRPTGKKTTVQNVCLDGFQGIDQWEHLVLWIWGEKMCSSLDRFIISFNKRSLWSWWWIYGFPLKARDILHSWIDGARKRLRSREWLKDNSMVLNLNESGCIFIISVPLQLDFVQCPINTQHSQNKTFQRLALSTYIRYSHFFPIVSVIRR